MFHIIQSIPLLNIKNLPINFCIAACLPLNIEFIKHFQEKGIKYGDVRNYSAGSRKQNHPVIKEYLGKRNDNR